jgi:hypothetical protein
MHRAYAILPGSVYRFAQASRFPKDMISNDPREERTAELNLPFGSR